MHSNFLDWVSLKASEKVKVSLQMNSGYLHVSYSMECPSNPVW